jgi:O-methyltransferase
MVDITLQGLSPRQLAQLGDAALEGGDVKLAHGLYRKLVELAPHAAQAHARLGLTLRPNSRTLTMLKVLKALDAIPNAQIFAGEGLATWLKTPPFIGDAKFMALAERDIGIGPAGISNWHWNLSIVLTAAQQASRVAGDFVELGVYKGHTTKFVCDYLDFAGWDRRWWLYDTFEGVPPDQQDPGRNVTAADYGEAFSFEEVRDRFASYPNVVVTRGRVPEVLAQGCPERIAFLHIDLNNAAAEVAALDALYDRISPGGVVVFDDFCWTTSQAQYKAETAWFAARGLAVFALPTGQGLFVKPPSP